MEKKLLTGCFWCYCAVMLCLLFGRSCCDITGDYWDRLTLRVNLVPLHTVHRYLHLLSGAYSTHLQLHAAVNLLGNIIMFLPLGFFPPMLWQSFRPLWRCLLRCGSLILCIELAQLTTLVGSCDIDDLLLNLLAVTLGYGLYRLSTPFHPKDGKKQRKDRQN